MAVVSTGNAMKTILLSGQDISRHTYSVPKHMTQIFKKSHENPLKQKRFCNKYYLLLVTNSQSLFAT